MKQSREPMIRRAEIKNQSYLVNEKIRLMFSMGNKPDRNTRNDSNKDRPRNHRKELNTIYCITNTVD